jgi:peroxiredoxin Q/BCP
MVKIGDKAPEFRLKTDEGGELSLSDFRGKRVVLFFFPRANTPG